MRTRVTEGCAKGTPSRKVNPMGEATPSWRGERGSSTERGYGSRWQRAREGWLRSNPLCVMCAAEGRTERATVVDHIKPHRGDMKLFWDATNWQSLCKQHHDSDKQMLERSGTLRTKFTEDGKVIW